LRYKIKDIPSEGLTVDDDVPSTLFAEALAGTDADLAHTRARVALELHKDRDENVYLRGRIQGGVTVPCASCLIPAAVPIDARLSLTFVREGDEGPASDSDDPLDEADVAFHDGESVDVAPILREQIILALPISARCKEGCLGLCSVCGQNKNESDCGHRPEQLREEQSPFAALKDLKLS
jgi:uncharacterized protein